MNTVHIEELQNIDYWVKIRAIELDRAKVMVQPHIDAINNKSKEIAKKYGVKPRLVSFHNFVR